MNLSTIMIMKEDYMLLLAEDFAPVRLSEEELKEKMERICLLKTFQDEKSGYYEKWGVKELKLSQLDIPLDEITRENTSWLNPIIIEEKYSEMGETAVVLTKKGKHLTLADIFSQLPSDHNITAIESQSVLLQGYESYQLKVKKQGLEMQFINLYRDRTHLKLLSKKQLVERASKIRGLIGDNNKIVREYPANEMEETSYIWEKTATTTETVGNLDLKVIRDVEMLSKYSYYGYFKPTIAEILSQIPEEDLPQVKYFKIVDSPQVENDFAKHREAFDDGFHTFTVRLYA